MSSFDFKHLQTKLNDVHGDQDPVVQRLVSTNLPLLWNFDPGFSISLFKGLFEIIVLTLFTAANHQIVDKNDWYGFSFKAFRPKIKFHPNPGLS